MHEPWPWERKLWNGRPTPLLLHHTVRRERYLLTDLRLLRLRGRHVDELAVDDIDEVSQTTSWLERRFGVSTVVVHPRRARHAPILLRGIRRGAHVAALLELLAQDARAPIDVDAARAAVEWEPRVTASGVREGLAGVTAVLVAVCAVAIGFHGTVAAPSRAPDDPIYPNGRKRGEADIVRFMHDVVLPWARGAIGPLAGGADAVTCETCHGHDADSRAWRMPAVAALPQPGVRNGGWEIYSGGMDAQMRNAIYGYVADSDNQAKAAYMREIVMPGMARLLRRPPYDFTRTYEFNRSRHAFGCYHCHMVR